MLNPRDVYIRACLQIGKHPADDYFGIRPVGVKEPTLELSGGNKKQVQILAKFLSSGVGTDSLIQAFNIFCSLNDRITLDGLLLYKPVEEIVSIQKMKRAVVEAYRDNFFNPQDFESTDTRMVFLGLIRDEAADTWFRVCAKKNSSQILFALTGVHSVSDDAVEDLKAIRAKATANYLTFGDFPADALVSGLTKEQLRTITIAQKEAALAIKATQVEMNSSDMLEQLKKFLKDMKMDVKEDDLSQYEVDNGADIDASLAAQYDKVSPLSKADDSDIPDDMLAGSGD